MAFGFGKKNKKNNARNASSSNLSNTLDESGTVEIVSKNFKMVPTQKLCTPPEEDGERWICWGCGQPTTKDICPVCGKKRTK